MSTPANAVALILPLFFGTPGACMARSPVVHSPKHPVPMADTFTKEEIDRWYEDIWERMLTAEWVHRFAHLPDGHWHVEWTPVGLQRSMLLRQLVDACDLTSGDQMPAAFDYFMQGRKHPFFHFTIPFNKAVADFWGECVKTLRLRGDEDGLLVFAHLLVGYAPKSLEEDIRILPPGES